MNEKDLISPACKQVGSATKPFISTAIGWLKSKFHEGMHEITETVLKKPIKGIINKTRSGICAVMGNIPFTILQT